MTDIRSAVGASSYPGRGILIGKSADARRALLAYFIMGRSVNSRNRVFVPDGNGLDMHTEAFDPSKMVDPSLIIYYPVRGLEVANPEGLQVAPEGRPPFSNQRFEDGAVNRIIVTNGDQTDTICDDILAGGSFHRALTTRTFEPDAPNFTPRISAMVTRANGDFKLEMSVLRCCDPERQAALRSFFEYDSLRPGEGRFIHTYASDGDPLPSFTGEPEEVALGDDFDEFTESVWTGLDEDNKVSLWTCCLDLATGETLVHIRNKNQ